MPKAKRKSMKSRKKRVITEWWRFPGPLNSQHHNTTEDWQNPATDNKSPCPAITYWLALTTPNGAPASPIVVHRTLLKCGVSVRANKVRNHSFIRYLIFQNSATTIDIVARLWGIKYSVCWVYSSEPRAEVYCLQLNFNISTLAYQQRKKTRKVGS